MKRTARLGGLIAASAITLGLLGGPAHAAEPSFGPGDDFFVDDCAQPALITITVNNTSGGVVSEPNCSRDTFIVTGRK